MSLRRNVLILALSAGLPACNPYKNFNGDYYLGPVDPGCPANLPSGPGTACTPFPADYVGVGFTPAQQNGVVMPRPATVAGGASILYYPFHVSAQYDPVHFADFGLAGPSNPLRLRTQTTDANTGAPIDKDRQRFYPFDITAGMDPSTANTTKCAPPSADYVWDERADAFPFNQQLNIFQQRQVSADPAGLPSEQPSYQPIYAEVPVTSLTYNCQSIHSADGVVDGIGSETMLSVNPAPKGSPDFRQVGAGDGFYRALAVIDPSADVITVWDEGQDPAIGAPNCPLPTDDLTGACHNPITHLGPQRWGFFDHFLVAYIDGGYVPTKMTTVMGMGGAPDQTITSAQPMLMYVPNQFNDQFLGPSTCNDTKANPADCAGHGFDVIDGVGSKPGVRNATGNGYSPICHVLSYDPTLAGGIITDPAQATDPNFMAALDPDTSAFIYCLQVVQATQVMQ
jgi:hypothetical protein